MSSLTSTRARIAALSRSRSDDDPDLVAARQRLKEMRLTLHIQEAVDTAPPLTEAQRASLAALLTGGAA